MTNDFKSPREELAERIVEGDTDIMTVIAAVLVNEVQRLELQEQLAESIRQNAKRKQ